MIFWCCFVANFIVMFGFTCIGAKTNKGQTKTSDIVGSVLIATLVTLVFWGLVTLMEVRFGQSVW